MALIRLAYAADLPPTDKLVRDLMDGSVSAGRAAPSAPSGGSSGGPRMAVSNNERPQSVAAVQPMAQTVAAPQFQSLEDLAAYAHSHGAPVLKVHIENDMHLVSLEPGRLEFRPSSRAPRSLAADLGQKLKDWTGARWAVTVVSQGGALTLSEQKSAAKQARHEAVLQEPLVRAVMDRFPGAEIMAVRDLVAEDDTAMPDADEE
jgi:DNA polymerase-3 subunit gamma/tau